jgi:hypothetical protein
MNLSSSPDNPRDLRYVNIPCPSGLHDRSIVTFRDYVTAVMFCINCEQAWTEPTSHPELRAMVVDRR